MREPGTPEQPAPTVRVFDAIQFAFRDESWKMNLLIGPVFLLIPIVGPLALLGWYAEVHQRLARRDPQPIPVLDFQNFGRYLERGLPPFVVQLVIAVAAMPVVLAIELAAAAGVAAIGAGPAVFGRDQAPPAAFPLPAVLLIGIAGALVLAFSLALSVLASAAVTRAELTGSFERTFELGGVFRYAARTFGPAAVNLFLYGLLAMGVAVPSLLLCCVGILPASIVIGLGSVHLRWQIYEQQLARGGERIGPS